MEGAFKEHIKALVLAGFPTTKTLTSLLANNTLTHNTLNTNCAIGTADVFY